MSKRNLGKKSIFMRLSTTNIDQQLPNSKYQLMCFQLKEEGRIKHGSPLSFSNDRH